MQLKFITNRYALFVLYSLAYPALSLLPTPYSLLSSRRDSKKNNSMEMDLVLKFGLEINSPIIFQFLYSNHAFWTLLIIVLFTVMAASKQLLHDIQDNFDGYKYRENSKVR